MDSIQLAAEAAYNVVDAITPTAFDDAMAAQEAQMALMTGAIYQTADWQRQQMQDIADKARFNQAMDSIALSQMSMGVGTGASKHKSLPDGLAILIGTVLALFAPVAMTIALL